MLDLIRYGIALLLEGKLFRDWRYFYTRVAIGIAATAGLMLVASLAIESMTVLALFGGLASGALQPCLFKDVKYR